MNVLVIIVFFECIEVHRSRMVYKEYDTDNLKYVNLLSLFRKLCMLVVREQ